MIRYFEDFLIILIIELQVGLILIGYSSSQEPMKSIHFGNSNPLCHAFDPDTKDGHDLLIGLNSGDGKYFTPGI